MASISLLILGLALSPFCFAEEQTITLRDGTIVKGEVLQMADGIYSVKSSSMGVTQIKAEQVASISAINSVPNNTLNNLVNPSATPPASQGSVESQVNQLQTSIVSNPALMAEIQQLASDPDVIKLISNPAIMQAATTKDVNALKNNPAAQELMQNPKVKALIDKLRSGNTGSGQ